MNLESAPGTFTYNQEHQIKIDEEKQKFLDDLKFGKIISHIAGIYAPEDVGGDAYLEEIIRPETGGTYLKVYGNPILYKGNASNNVVFLLQMPKSILFSGILRQFVKNFPLSLAWKWIFGRKKLLKLLYFIANDVDHKAIEHLTMPEDEKEANRFARIKDSEHNEFEKEIERAMNVAVREPMTKEKEIVLWKEGFINKRKSNNEEDTALFFNTQEQKLRDIESAANNVRKYREIQTERFKRKQSIKKVYTGGQIRKFEGRHLWHLIILRLLPFAKKFFFVDNTYRFRLQDMFGEMDEQAAKENGVKELFRILGIMLGRETGSAVKEKWKFIQFAGKIVLSTSPALKGILNRFMANLDKSKLIMDEADYYWSLKFRSYNFRGESMEQRYAERERLDKENHIIYLI